MFAEDGAFDMSYLESLGFAWRRGRDRIEGFFKFGRDLYPEMEFEFTTRSSKSARVIHQLFVGRLACENGKIKLLRESINLVELGLAICTKGFADYKILEERVA